MMNNEELLKRQLLEAVRQGRSSALSAAATLCQMIAMTKGGTAQMCVAAVWKLKTEMEDLDKEKDENAAL